MTDKTPTLLHIRGLAACAAFALLTSCVTVPDWTGKAPLPKDLPAEISINQGAGRGDHLYMTLHTESGEKLLFLVDTGSPYVMLDKSLEPKLGRRLGPASFKGYFENFVGDFYSAPKFFLGGTQLIMGNRVATADFHSKAFPTHGRPVMGILGMDCLRHYCLQLDFQHGKLRFLNPDAPEDADSGKPFPMTSVNGHVVIPGNLIGATGRGMDWSQTQIDTGANEAGMLHPKLFRQWTNEGAMNAAAIHSPDGVFDGHVYPALSFDVSDKLKGNTMGLTFLARHQATMNFPKQILYLHRWSTGPLTNDTDSRNTLAWWERDASKTPDKTALADGIMGPPNLHPSGAMSELIWKINTGTFGFRPLRIPLGPPGEFLSALQLPPANYHMAVSSSFRDEEKASKEGSASIFRSRTDSPVPLPERGTIVLLHDYNQQKEPMSFWAYVLAQAGYRVVLVDLRGHGESTGQIISYGKLEVADLEKLLDSLTNRTSRSAGVLGIGYGAHIALQWAARDPRITTVIAIAPYNSPVTALERMAADAKPAISSSQLQEALGVVATRLEINWADWSGESAIRKTTVPVFIIGGSDDAVSPPKELEILVKSARAGSKLLVIEKATHGLIGFWFQELAKPVIEWFDDHPTTGNPQAKANATPPAKP